MGICFYVATVEKIRAVDIAKVGTEPAGIFMDDLVYGGWGKGLSQEVQLKILNSEVNAGHKGTCL